MGAITGIEILHKPIIAAAEQAGMAGGGEVVLDHKRALLGAADSDLLYAKQIHAGATHRAIDHHDAPR